MIVDILPEIARADTKRDKKRLDVIMKIRLDNPELRVLNAPWKKALLCLLVEARLHPDTPFAKAIRDLRWEDRSFAEKIGMMSPDTILRDSRELEALGFFEKGDEQG